MRERPNPPHSTWVVLAATREAEPAASSHVYEQATLNSMALCSYM